MGEDLTRTQLISRSLTDVPFFGWNFFFFSFGVRIPSLLWVDRSGLFLFPSPLWSPLSPNLYNLDHWYVYAPTIKKNVSVYSVRLVPRIYSNICREGFASWVGGGWWLCRLDLILFFFPPEVLTVHDLHQLYTPIPQGPDQSVIPQDSGENNQNRPSRVIFREQPVTNLSLVV